MAKRTKIIITLGILTALTPFLGFPGAVKSGAVVVFGLAAAIYMYWTEKHISICEDCIHNESENTSAPAKSDEAGHSAKGRIFSGNEPEKETESGNNGDAETKEDNDRKDASEQETIKEKIKEE